MNKLPGITKILCHLKEAFLKKVDRMPNIYNEARILFDRYIENSLKAKRRAKRATSTAAATASYDIHNQISISTISLKEILSSSKTKKLCWSILKVLVRSLCCHTTF